MSATVLSFPQRASSPAPRPGVCVHWWHPRVTDFSFYGLGKWCDGCVPVLKEMAEKIRREGRTAPHIEGVGPVRSARLAHGRGGGVD
jgi:hypothetical protein